MGGVALDRHERTRHLRVRDIATGGSQRVAGSGIQYGGSRETHLDRQRGVDDGTALFCRHGALADLQRIARGARRTVLSGAAVAPGTPRQPARTSRRHLTPTNPSTCTFPMRILNVAATQTCPIQKADNREAVV